MKEIKPRVQLKFQPSKLSVGQERPHLRKKYSGGIWGYGKELNSTGTPNNLHSRSKITLVSSPMANQSDLGYYLSPRMATLSNNTLQPMSERTDVFKDPQSISVE